MTIQAVGKKRIRRDPATTTTLILDEAERLMVEDGYASVTTRRIAQSLGINAATVHYYFPITDDLFIALHGRMMARQRAELEAAMEADDPISAFWSLQWKGAQAALGVEFLALANHRKAICERLAAATEATRGFQAGLIERVFGKLQSDIPPVVLSTVLVALGRLLANEERVGITAGHPEVRQFVSERLVSLRKG